MFYWSFLLLHCAILKYYGVEDAKEQLGLGMAWHYVVAQLGNLKLPGFATGQAQLSDFKPALLCNWVAKPCRSWIRSSGYEN